MSSIQVTVPIVFWGRRAPSHEICSICKPDTRSGMATGSKSGQICIWDLHKRQTTGETVLRPRLLLFGGNSSMISLSFVRNWSGDHDRVISLSKEGTLALWDGRDGSCLKVCSTLLGKHIGVQCLARERYKETLIAVYGRYTHVYILDSNTLEQVCILKSSHNPNWISQMCFISHVEGKKDGLAAVTVDGIAKLWLLPTSGEMREMKDLHEERSTALGISNPLSLSSWSLHGYSVMLAVCRDSWQLYDASGGKMKQLLIRPCETGVKAWVGGACYSYDHLLTWTQAGETYVYQLSPQVLPGIHDSSEEVDSSTAGLKVLCVLGQTSSAHSTAAPPIISSGLTFASYLDHECVAIGDNNGRLCVWNMEKILYDNVGGSLRDCDQPDLIPCHFTAAMSDSWASPAEPCSLTDTLNHDTATPEITCALYLAKFSRLVCGQSNGQIAIVWAAQAATKLLLKNKKFSKNWPQHYFLKGHTGKITCLLYPCDYSTAYNSNYLLSGGADFSVRLWDLYQGVLVHTFAMHGGQVKNIVPCPPELNPRLQTCVCSVADDHSVAILSTSERKSLLLASCHISPVESVRWRLDEDFLLVKCTDGRLYIWQIETGTLDRCVDGETARIILENTPPPLRALTTPSSYPLQVRNLRVSKANSRIQVLLFDPQTLINKLSRMEKIEVAPKGPAQPTRQARAFRNYMAARFSSTKSPPTPRKQVASSSSETSTPPRSSTQSSPSSVSSLRRDPVEKAREILSESMARKMKDPEMESETPTMIVNIARLLISCLHAWNLDEQLDKDCENMVGLVRPVRPVSFGLLSRGCLSLVLPGWGLVANKPAPTEPAKLARSATVVHQPAPGVKQEDVDVIGKLIAAGGMLSESSEGETQSRLSESVDDRALAKVVRAHTQSVTEGGMADIDDQSELAVHVRWQMSRSLTTQHLLTVVSITNTLMNQSAGAHALSSSTRRVHRKSAGGSEEESDESDGDDSGTVRDNIIRAVWSRIAALHCVMLPERMDKYFRSPHLPVLAARFMDPCQAIREAAQALLQSELRRVGRDGRRMLVKGWAGKLQTPSSFTKTAHEANRAHDEGEYGDIGLGSQFAQATPTQQQQTTALIILGMIGAEFNTETKSMSPHNKRSRSSVKSLPPHLTDFFELLDPTIARQTAKTLQAVLLEKPLRQSSVYSPLRCSAAELMGRGFHLWENYVDVAAVIMGLLDLAIHSHNTSPSTPPTSPSATSTAQGEEDKTLKKLRASRFVSEIAKRALNLMVLLRPVTIVLTLAKEVSIYQGTQHGNTFPHSARPPIQVGMTPPPNTPGLMNPANMLLPAARDEILLMMRTILDKCSTQISMELLDVVDIVLFCLDQDELKKANFMELFPSLARLPNVSYSHKNRRLAVGARSGQVTIYDLKQTRVQMVNAHTHPVTVLRFSEDGKLLATYSYGGSLLDVWQLGTSLFGGVISQPARRIQSWPAVCSSSPASYSSYSRLEWVSHRSIVLHMPGGIEYKYSL